MVESGRLKDMDVSEKTSINLNDLKFITVDYKL